MQEFDSDYFKNFFASTPKIILTFLAIGFLVYFNALFGQFVWDDELQIIQTPFTYSIKNIPFIFSVGQLDIFYRPVFYSFLTIIHSLFGLNVFFFHILQLLIHIANTAFIFLIFSKFLGRKISFLLSLLFLIHPMNVEAVAYISAISDPLFIFFGLTAFYIMTRDKVTVLSLLTASFLMLFSLLTKEAGALLLFIVLVYRFLFKKKNKVNMLINALFAILPLGLYFFLRFAVAHTFFTKVHFAPIAQASLFERLITIPKIIFFYISTFFIPVNLSIAQHWVVKSFNVRDFLLPLIFDFILFISIVVIGINLFKKNRKAFIIFLFFLLWLIIGLAFYLQVVPLDMTVAERWFYLPMIGFLGLIGTIIHNLRIFNGKIKIFGMFVISIILIFFPIRTLARNANWHDAYTLFGHDIQVTKDSFDIENNYSKELMVRGKYKEAFIHAEKAIQLAPKYTATWTNMGIIYMNKKEYKRAIGYFLKALENDGGNYAAFYNMIYAYTLLSDNNSAKGWSEHALKSFPNDPQLLLFQAIAEYRLGNKAKALELARQSYDLKPTVQSQYINTTMLNNQPLNIE